jgi:thiol:disulfide interchange protein
MRKTIVTAVLLILLATALWAQAPETASDKPVEKPSAPRFTNLEEAKATALAKDKPVLVDFYADW